MKSRWWRVTIDGRVTVVAAAEAKRLIIQTMEKDISSPRLTWKEILLEPVDEPLNIPDLLEKTQGFPPKLRALMAVFGTLQGALSLLFGEEVTVRVVGQVEEDWKVVRKVVRQVELVAGDRVVATATSRIACTIAQQSYLSDILAGKMGIGQLLTKHGINYQTRLSSCGQDNDVCWRTYNIWGPGISIIITERFPKGLYESNS